MAMVLVKEKGVACGSGLSTTQPSSPYQFTRHGVLRHRLLDRGPDWAAITGTDLGPEQPGPRRHGRSLAHVAGPQMCACPVGVSRPGPKDYRWAQG